MKPKTTKEIIHESHVVFRNPFDFYACKKCDLNTNHNIKGDCLLCQDKETWVLNEELQDRLSSILRRSHNSDKIRKKLFKLLEELKDDE